MNIKKKILAVLAAVVSCGVIFTGCADGIESGTVIDKEYKPEHTYTTYIRTSNGIMVPCSTHHDAQYKIKLSGEENGETVTGWIYVSESVYESYNIGDYYP
ncbi:MAG: hypothetical protein K2H01_07530 [Ruminococcus sp.]|nr:hypothetical protein [Ruminococcus sp.]